MANPKGEKIVHGHVNVQAQENRLSITQESKKAIIEWDDFSIGLHETVNIKQVCPGAAVLNRVTGTHPSKIFGSLQSNGFVYLINEQGIIIGKEGAVTTKGFLASCLNLKNESFLQGKTLVFRGNHSKELMNLGTIRSLKGPIFLLAQVVKNEGKILAKKEKAYLIGSDHVYLTKDHQVFVQVESNGKVENKGSIQALSTHIEASGGNIYEYAINQAGIIEANGIEHIDGRVILKAHSSGTNLSGSIVAQSDDLGGMVQIIGGDHIHIQDNANVLVDGKLGGGTVLVGGDYQGKKLGIENTKNIWVGKKAFIRADATDHGNGGKVIVWGNENNLFGGTVSAKGGINGGNGGLVEISSKNHLLYKGFVYTNAPRGRTGTLLLDPSDITISGGASSPTFPTAPGEYDPVVASATLNAADLVNITDGLENNDVIVSTSSGVGGGGNVTFAANVSWSAATTLTVLADTTITINTGIALSNTSTASNFTAFDFRGNEGGGASGGTTGIDVFGSVSSVNGNINFVGEGGGSPTSSAIGIYLRSTSTGLSSTGTGVNAATITLNGSGGSGTGGSHGVVLEGSGDRITSVDGNISVTGQGGGGDPGANTSYGIFCTSGANIVSSGTGSSAATITLNGTGGDGTSGNSGIRLSSATTSITSVSGDINITAIASGTTTANRGIDFAGGSITSTGTGPNAATITLVDVRGSSTGTDDCAGLYMNGAGSLISSEVGAVDITALGGGSGASARGVAMVGTGGTISSTGTGSDAATVTIDATGGPSGTATSHGFELGGNGVVTSVAGDINITGLAQNVGNGISIFGDILSTSTGSSAADITLHGTGAGGSNIGINLASSGALIESRSDSSTITLTGIGITGFATTAGSSIGGGSTLGPIIINTETITLAGNIQSSGALTIRPTADSTTIGLGNASTGTLNLTATEIGLLADGFSSISFGRTTQDSTVDMEAITYNDPIIVYGKQIEVDGMITAGANDVTLNIGPSSSGTLNLDANVTTTGTFSVNGGSSSDAFNINVTGQTATIDGGGGTNTLTGPGAVNTWTITADDAGTLDSITFSNIQNLIGNTSSDSFTFNGAFQVSGSIDGSTGINTVTGPNVLNSWTISADDAGTITPTGASGATSLTNITNLTGGSFDDTFTFNGAFQISGAINGGGGSNTINGPNVNNTWAVVSQTTGTITPTGATGPTTYSNVGTLVGNSADDTFNLSADITLPSITAGTGTDTLTFLPGWTIAATVDLNTTMGFEVINGPPGLDNTLIGNNLSNTWTVTSANAGTLQNTTYPFPFVLTFSNFPNLTGGNQNDTFDLTGGFSINSVDGSTGFNTLLAPNTVNTWNITENNSGMLNAIAFSNTQNLTGGNLADTFIFTNQQGIDGQIDGGAPASSNTLDYSAFSPVATVQFLTPTSGTASNLGNGFVNIANIIGNVTIITSSTLEKSSFYFTNLQLLFTELYHNRLIPEFFYRQFEPTKYVYRRQEKIRIQVSDKIPLIKEDETILIKPKESLNNELF